ncbi:hypothetical protein Tco_1260716 [Tanacetum coccineum]
MSALVFVDPEIPTQADGAQSPRVPAPFPEDPYEAIRQGYLVETNTKAKPFEDPVETKTPESPYIITTPTSLPDSTPPTHHAGELEDSSTSGTRSTPSNFTTPLSPDHPLTHTSPTLVLFFRRTIRMAVRVPPVMSPSLSSSIAEVVAMSDLAFRKRFRSSYESSPSSSSPYLPSWKRSRGIYELVEDDKEGDKVEEVKESSDSNSESEDAEDEGPTIEDEGLAAGDEGLDAGDEGPGIRVESLSLGGDEVVPEGQQRAALVMETVIERVSPLRQPTLTTWIDLEDDRVYIDVPVYPPPAPYVQTPPSLEWSFGLLPIFPAPSIVPSPISSPTIPLTVPSPVASPITAKTEGFLTELGAHVEMQGGLIRDHVVRLGELSHALFKRYDKDIGELFTRSGTVRDEIFSQRYRLRSLSMSKRGL